MAPLPPSASGPASDDLTGRLLAGRYRLNRPIASGGMAQVWEATDQVLARRVAVKILHPHLARDDSFVKRFRAEAIAAARLAHPSIVSVYDTVADGGVDAIVMELVVGTTMRADLDQHGPLQLAAVLAIGTQVADALGAAHASGLVHRDVKPANILLSADGRVLVADFGIAKATEGADLTSDGSMVGTAKYLAPEQVEGTAVDGRTDLYALGVVLYEALTGTPPFVADTDVGTALARLHRDATPPRQLRPQIPPAVAAVVTKAMSRRPVDRYPDARAMRAALLAAGADPGHAPAAARSAVAAVTGERPVAGALPPPPADPSPPPARSVVAHQGHHDHDGDEYDEYDDHEHDEAPRRRRRWPVPMAAVLVLAAVAYGVVRFGASSDGDDAPGPAVAVTGLASFDPEGPGDGEKDELLELAADGDPATVWRTDSYKDPSTIAGKGGVGIIARVDAATDLGRLDLTTPEGGWRASIYVHDGDLPTDLAGWGEPVGAIDGARSGANRVDLLGRRGTAVLVWFTELPPTGFAAVGEIGLRAS